MKTELLTALRLHATRLISELRASREPVLITAYGKPAAYLVDVDSYEFLDGSVQPRRSTVSAFDQIGAFHDE